MTTALKRQWMNSWMQGPRSHAGEKLYIIESPSFSGIWIYTKGVVRRKGGQEVFYVLVSAKIAE